MSQHELTQFLAAVRQDPALQEKLRQPGVDPVAIARAAGFTITLAEFNEPTEALSEEDLEGLSGGQNSIPGGMPGTCGPAPQTNGMGGCHAPSQLGGGFGGL